MKSLVAALTVSVSVSAAAAPLVVRVSTHPSAGELMQCTIQIEANESKRRDAVALSVGTPMKRDLPPGLYTIELTQRGYWARSSTVYVADKGAIAEILVFRESAIYGRLAAGTTAPPRALSARFQATGTSTDQQASGEIACTVNGRNWTCPVPALRLDVTLKAPAHIAQHRWDVDATRGPADIGALELKRGASLVGYVASGDPAVPKFEDAVVELLPLGAREETVSRVKTNARGFFHFDGVAPGAYRARATRGPLVSAHEVVRIIGDTEASLRQPLLLLPPHDVTLSVTPAHDPFRHSWVVEVVREEEPHGATTIERIVELPASGRGILERLPAGSYSLNIRNAAGSVYARRDIVVPNEADVAITLRSTRVMGTVSLGGNPLQASLNFAGDGFSIDTHTNKAGKFLATLPAADVRRVPRIAVRSEDPLVERTLRDVMLPDDVDNQERRRLNIDFADSFLAGEIVDESGKPVPSAVVRMVSGGGIQEVRARDDGTFDIHGIEPGTVRLRAVARDNRMSDEVPITIASVVTNPASVRLVVRAGFSIEGTVRSITGVVPGAVVLAFPVGSADGGSYVAFLDPTGPDGRYKVNLPAGVSEVDMIVSAPGFAQRFFRYPLAAGRNVDLPVRQETADLTLFMSRTENLNTVTITHAGATRSLQLVSSVPLHAVESDGKLSLRLRDLEPGHYTICTRTRCASANAAPFSNTMFDLAAEGK